MGRPISGNAIAQLGLDIQHRRQCRVLLIRNYSIAHVMSDRIRSETIAANERIKFLSNVGGNLGTALFATAIGRWFLSGFDPFVLIWLSVSVLVIWTAWYVLTMIESEV